MKKGCKDYGKTGGRYSNITFEWIYPRYICAVFNLNSVVTEISSAIIGSIALLLCVPFTAFIAASFSKLSNEKLEKYDIISSVFRKKE